MWNNFFRPSLRANYNQTKIKSFLFPCLWLSLLSVTPELLEGSVLIRKLDSDSTALFVGVPFVSLEVQNILATFFPHALLRGRFALCSIVKTFKTIVVL